MAGVEKVSADQHSRSTADDAGLIAPQPTFGQRLKAHFKKWWWLWLFAFIVAVLVIVLPIIYVAIPNIAQDGVNDSTLEVELQKVTYPRPNSVRLEMRNVARSDSSFHPTLDGFEAALFLENTLPKPKPFGYLDIPEADVQAETVISINQTFDVTDMDQFTAYNKLVLQSEEFRLAIRGKTDLHLSGLSAIDVDYNKVVTMKGLNGFRGLTIPDFNISLTPAADGSNMQGIVRIPNPSVLYLELGQVVLNVYVEDTYIGNCTIGSLTLEPEQDNEFPMSSILNQTLVLGLLTRTYTDGILPLTIIGNSSTNLDGEHLTYYEQAMAATPIRLDLDVGSRISALLGGGGA